MHAHHANQTNHRRRAVNKNEIQYFDMHLSFGTKPTLRIYGKLDFAIVEAYGVYDDGRIIPCMGVGIAPTVLRFGREEGYH